MESRLHPVQPTQFQHASYFRFLSELDALLSRMRDGTPHLLHVSVNSVATLSEGEG